ncbi:MAG: ribbon-helix-helix protein, CopG family [Actinomycetota bacterium]|nr:ribbon-helix-helix protein, CopG family [Actinomycetota bacterium]
MRTTLTLDDDVAAQLDQLRARGTQSFKELVNEVLRAGLQCLESAEHAQPRGPYTRAVSLGKVRLPDVDDVSEALAVTEGDDYR